jgi:hypothetical protein
MSEIKCCICIEDIDNVNFNTIRFECNHYNCITCYTEYAISRVKNMKSITCPICNIEIINIKDISSNINEIVNEDDFNILDNDDNLHRNNDDNLHRNNDDNLPEEVRKIDLNCMDNDTIDVMRNMGMSDNEIKKSIYDSLNFK